jgi:hypothetical protein
VILAAQRQRLAVHPRHRHRPLACASSPTLALLLIAAAVNLAISPDETLAIVASSLNVDDNGVLKASADNRLFVIDLTLTTRP